MNKITGVLVTLICTITVYSGSAQVVPNFNATVVQGCPPLSVDFNDLSTGNVQTVAWDFGNGQTSTTAANNSNPNSQYINSGVYDVTLIVNEGLADEEVFVQTAFITVFDEPVADFSSPTTSGCTPYTVDFTNLTTTTGTIDSWKWVFGDGSASNTTDYDASHTFNTLGTFDVNLEVTDNNNCKDDTTISYSVSQSPTVDFTTSSPIACLPPLNVTFTNTSTSGLLYNWDFGNGQTSNLEQPGAINYPDSGVFDVILTVTDPLGCSIVETRNGLIQITDAVASFTSDTGCVNAPLTLDNSATVGADTYTWDFGDGTTGTGSNPGHSYASAGEFIVTLVAENSAAGCQDTIVDTVYVEEFIAGFSVSPSTYNCSAPVSATIVDTSGSGTPVNWQWIVGNYDAVGDSLQNQDTTDGVSSINTTFMEGLYGIELSVTSTNGCVSSSLVAGTGEASVTVSLPVANFSITYEEENRCAPQNVTITDMSTPDINGTLGTWTWDMGDGSPPIVNPGPSFVHTYTTDGDFPVTLTVENMEGCSGSNALLAEIGAQLDPSMTISDYESCASDTLRYSGSLANPADESKLDPSEWVWQGTGGFGGTGQILDFRHRNVSAIGWNYDTLIVNYNECRDTINDSIFLWGPIVESVIIQQNCDNPDSVVFTPIMVDTTHYEWNWDDSWPNLSSPVGGGTIPPGTDNDSTGGKYHNPYHIYDGTSTVRIITVTAWNNNVPLSVDSNGCEYVFFESPFRISHIEANINAPDTVCRLDTLVFNGVNSQDAVAWNWDFDNDSTGIFTIDTNIYVNPGVYSSNLITTDANGCVAYDTMEIYVFQPIAGITTNTVSGCLPLTVNFSNGSSYPGLGDSLTVWNFGNGGALDTVSGQSVTYINRGVKTVELFITDSLGCKHDTSITIEVIQPFAEFTASDYTLCADSVTNFQDQSAGYLGGLTSNVIKWNWDFGDGNSDNIQNPQHSYALEGTYNVTLTVEDDLGCLDTVIKPSVIDVQAIPIASFTADSTVFTCYPASVEFTSTTISNFVDSWQWDAGTEGGLINDSVINVLYTSPGSYGVSLIASTNYGCVDTVEVLNYINITGPYAEFSLSPNTICVNESVTFTLDSLSDVASWEWNFGDGFKRIGGDTVQHIYSSLPVSGTFYVPTIILSSQDGLCKPSFTDTVDLRQVEASFLMNNSSDDTLSGCPPFDVTFSDVSPGAISWAWDLGNGTTSTDQHPGTETYPYSPSLYVVTLTVESDPSFGCIDSEVRYIEVHPIPDLDVHNDTMVCAGDAIQVWASGGVLYEWKPTSNIVGDSLISNPVVSADVPNTTFEVKITTAEGCIDSINMTIEAIAIADATLEIDSNPIFIGDSTNINVVLSDETYSYDYVWFPPTGIDCFDCQTTEFKGLETTTYFVTVTDEFGVCPPQVVIDTMVVIDEFSLDLPDVFSPNGDGANDTVYVKGYGIKKLVSFEIFNRWGERVYENVGGMSEGWDGNFGGKPQNMDTYIGVATVERFKGDPVTIKKHITLYR